MWKPGWPSGYGIAFRIQCATARNGSNPTLGKLFFLFNFKYIKQMCKCLDG